MIFNQFDNLYNLIENLSEAFFKIPDDQLKEMVLYCLAKLLLTVPSYEEFSREQETTFMTFIKNFTDNNVIFSSFWKRKSARLYIFSIVSKSASSTNSKRNLLNYIQFFNRWFTQDTSGKKDVDFVQTKLEYWELLMLYLTSKKYFCVEPFEDFEVNEHKDEANFEPYIYWDVSLFNQVRVKTAIKMLLGMNLKEEIKKADFTPDMETMLIQSIYQFIYSNAINFAKLEVKIIFDIIEIFDERLENSKATERVKFEREDAKIMLFHKLSQILPLRNYLLTKTKFIKKISKE